MDETRGRAPFGGDVLTQIPANRRAAHAWVGLLDAAADFHPGLVGGIQMKAPATGTRRHVLREPAWGPMEHMEVRSDEWPTRVRRLISYHGLIPFRYFEPNFSFSKCGPGSLGNVELRSRTDTKTQNRFSSTGITVRGLADELYTKRLYEKLAPADGSPAARDCGS